MPDESIAIREASPSDTDAIAPLFDLYRQFYKQPSDLSRAREFLRARLERGESRIFLAGSADHRALGFVQVYPSFSSVRCRPMWVLNDLYVAAGARGRGIADALLGATAKAAARENVSYISLTTEHTNATAQRLYIRCGYVLDEDFRTYALTINT